MAEEEPTVGDDIAWIDAQLADPGASFEALRAEHPFLRSVAEARRYLEDIRVALVDVLEGRVVSHEQIGRDVEERRRRYRSDAAE
jgi:hypothetical protein